jgi:hypothetical protein
MINRVLLIMPISGNVKGISRIMSSLRVCETLYREHGVVNLIDLIPSLAYGAIASS